MNENIFRSPYKPVRLSEEKTLPTFLLRKAQQHIHNKRLEWIIDSTTGEKYLFRDFEVLTKRIASAFYKKGLRKGDIVLYATEDMVKLQLFLTGIWRANGIARPSYLTDDAETLMQRVRESRVGWILCDPANSEMCLYAADRLYWDIEVIVVGAAEECTSLDEFFQDDGSELPELQISENDPAFILCPTNRNGIENGRNGVVQTHKSVLAMIATFSRLPLFENKPNLILTNATHYTGAIIPLVIFSEGKTGIVVPQLSRERILGAIRNYKPGFVWGLSVLLEYLEDDSNASITHDFNTIEIAVKEVASLEHIVMDTTLKKFPNLNNIIKYYGLPEVTPISLGLDMNNKNNTLKDIPEYSCGKLCPGVSVQIRDSDSGEILNVNQSGEIFVKAATLFSHYYKNQEATKNAFLDEWFKIGETGYINVDGFLFNAGGSRLKDMFIDDGNSHDVPHENQDTEVEILQHPAVDEVCVVRVVNLRSRGEEKISRAFVTLKENFYCSPEELQKFANCKNLVTLPHGLTGPKKHLTMIFLCLARLPEEKHLKGGVYILPELPKGKTGKIIRDILAKIRVP